MVQYAICISVGNVLKSPRTSQHYFVYVAFPLFSFLVLARYFRIF